METGQLAGYPGALADITYDADGTDFIGAMGMIIVDDKVSFVFATAPPEQWPNFEPTFAHMFFSLSFFEPE